jgi:hypothetical protein
MKPPFKSKQDWEYAQRKLGECVGDVICSDNVRKAIAYISPTLTIKATAQRRNDRRAKSATVLVTVGKPNFAERRHIKVCQKAGMCFPLNHIEWKNWPNKKR